MKGRILRWEGYVARLGNKWNEWKVLWGNLMERDNLEDLFVDGVLY
jgi:hypothetical protein